MKASRLLVALGGLSTCLFGVSTAEATPPDAEVTERLGFLESRLEAGTGAAERWSYGWLGAFGTLSVAQFGVALGTTDPGLRADTAVGAVSASLGCVPFALFPFAPRLAASELRLLPANTPDERRRKLARAEALMKKSAKAEKFGRSWVPHVAGTTVAIVWGVVLAAAYHRVRSGIINATIGSGIVELQIWTQPTAAITDWKAYSDGHYRIPPKAPAPRVGFGVVDGQLGLLGSF